MRSSRVSATLVLAAVGAAIYALSPTPALGQVDAGAVRGTVTDSSGAVVANAKVSLTNKDTGLVVSTVAAGDGTYTFSPVKIGQYTVAVQVPGFKAAVSEIVVNIQDQIRADFQLKPGAASETVTVTSTAPQLQTQDASVGPVATQSQINNLPLNGRNSTFLAQLSPGITSQSPTRGLDLSGSFVANGLSSVHNNYMLDGVDNNNDTVDFLNGNAFVTLPPPDAIQEFKVQTSNFSAEFGRAGGAVLNAAIKSGTNEFHGSAWEFLRNDKLDAVDVGQYFFVNKVKKGELRRNQFGGSAGGPIRKNKLFIFGDYEGTRIRTGVAHNPTVPTALQGSSGFTDFRDLFSSTTATSMDSLGRTFSNATIFDPATTRPVTAGSVDPATGLTAQSTGFVRDPFYTNGSIAGIKDFTGLTQFMNQLPAGRLDANAIKLLQLYPPANVANTIFNNYQITRGQPDNADHFDIRVDPKISERDQLFGRVSYTRRGATILGDLGGVGDNTPFGGGDFKDRSTHVAISETHAFSSTLVNEARFGYSHLYTSAQPPEANTQGIPDQYGIPGIPQGSGNGGLPTIGISGLTSLGAAPFASPNNRTSDTIQLSENLTKVAGGHTFKGGFEYQSLHFPWIAPAWSRGEFDFGGFTGIPNITSGAGMADLLLTPISATVPGGVNNVGGAGAVFASNITQPDDMRKYYGSYFQDDWKVNSKLTLNMGLRWEIFAGMTEANGKQAGLLPGAPDGSGAQYLILSRQKNTPLSPAFVSQLAADGIQLKYVNGSSIISTPLKDFAPRFGLAYQITPKLVARAAYGVFFAGFENIGGSPDPGYNYPFAVNLGFFAPSQVAPLIYANGQQATLENGLTPANPNPNSPNFSPQGLAPTAYQTKWKTGYVQEWNASVQYQLGSSQTITVSYVGNNSQHLENSDVRNVPTLILPPGVDPQQYVPFKDFARGTGYLAADGSAYYHGISVNFERRFSRGLNLLANYTRSECKTDTASVLGVGGANGARAPLLPGFGLKKDYQYCIDDAPNIFHASGIWELPIGKVSSSALNAIIGGWSTQWIFALQDGFPFSIGCNPSTTSDFGCYANVAPGQSIYAHKGAHGTAPFLNAAAFVNPPAATTIGQTDYSPLGGAPMQAHGPGYDNLDFSMFKKFRTTEKTNLEFRGEFFNFFNHPNFSNSFVTLDFRNTAQFGQVNGTRGIGREIQLALKLYW